MTKARDIPGLHAGMTFAEAAAATIATRAEELFDEADGVLDMDDIERVHDMRVATRRLRAVLEIYGPCFPRELFRPVLAEVKALADALGERRDPDVLLERLATLEEALPKAAAPGIEAFAEPLRAAQRHGNEVLAVALAEAERSDLRGRLAALAAAALAPRGEPDGGGDAEVAGIDPLASGDGAPR